MHNKLQTFWYSLSVFDSYASHRVVQLTIVLIPPDIGWGIAFRPATDFIVISTFWDIEITFWFGIGSSGWNDGTEKKKLIRNKLGKYKVKASPAAKTSLNQTAED